MRVQESRFRVYRVECLGFGVEGLGDKGIGPSIFFRRGLGLVTSGKKSLKAPKPLALGARKFLIGATSRFAFVALGLGLSCFLRTREGFDS